MKLSENIVKKIKRYFFGMRGEPFKINSVKIYFQPGSRPTREKYLNSSNTVVRNDILQQHYFAKRLKPDSVLWDIGAHYGTYSLFSSAYIKNNDCIFAFEPDEQAVLILKKNLLFNDLHSKIKIFELAVSSHAAVLNFDMQDGNANSHLITNNGITSLGQIKEVRSVTLNEMLETIPKPDFIKIDTEGAELDIIKGAGKLLKDSSITFICELHPFAWDWYKDVSWMEFSETIKKSGRTIIPLDTNKNISDLPFYGTVIF